MVNVLLFPGQGAQKVGMGKDLAEAFPAARDTFAAIDEALGVSLSSIMWAGPEDELLQTHHTQPAILAHSAAVLAVLGHRLGPVVAAAGHSLGEYSAYVAAGSIPATTAARLVRRRGELMHQAGQERPGAMAAVIGLPAPDVEACCARSGGDGIAVAANLNAPDQTVLSGDPQAVQTAGEACKAAGAKKVIPLKVSGAFHSPLMAPAVPGLAAALDEVTFGDPAFPVVANATAEPVRTGQRARELLLQQLTAPVRWVECLQRIASLAPEEVRFLELGPGTALGGMLKRTLGPRAYQSLGTRAEVEAMLA